MTVFKTFILGAIFFLTLAPANAEKLTEPDQVQHLYDKAFEAGLTLDTRDPRLMELASEQISLYQNIKFAKKALSEIKHPIFRSEVLAKIAREEAKQGNCESAEANLMNAYNADLADDLSKRQRHYRSGIALRAVVEAYTYCGKIDKAVKIVQDNIESSLKEKQYLANAYSAIAAIRYKLDDTKTAKKYFQLALDIAKPVQNETHRSDAMSNIAYNQMAAGLYEDAFKTALDIKQTNKPAYGMALRFSTYRNSALIKISCHYASIDNWEKADLVLINQSILDGSLYPACFTDAYLKKIMTMDRGRALKSLRMRAHSLKKYNKDKGLMKIALAYSDFGEQEKATLILDRLYQKYLTQYQEEIEDKRSPSPAIIWFIDDILAAYVLVNDDMNNVIEKITAPPFANLKSYRFKNTWGALIGRSTIEQNETILERIKPILADDLESSAFLFHTFLYFLEIENFEKAREAIDKMPLREKPGAYMMLARKILNIQKGDYATQF